jgi:hypothetical protein
MIEHYSFGSMKIDGKLYKQDLIIFPDRVKSNWRRKEAHSLAIEDLNEIIDYRPEILIIGRGASNCMKILPAIKDVLKRQGIELLEKDTDSACKLFNDLIEKGKKIAGAFHLTC